MSKAPQGSRGAGFGLDAELARKQAEKYDHNAEKQAKDWIEAVTGERLEGAFGAALKNGQALCKLINTIKPGSVKKIETSVMPFKQMENISNFLRACRALGVREYELFETIDLYEEKVSHIVPNEEKGNELIVYAGPGSGRNLPTRVVPYSPKVSIDLPRPLYQSHSHCTIHLGKALYPYHFESSNNVPPPPSDRHLCRLSREESRPCHSVRPSPPPPPLLLPPLPSQHHPQLRQWLHPSPPNPPLPLRVRTPHRQPPPHQYLSLPLQVVAPVPLLLLRMGLGGQALD